MSELVICDYAAECPSLCEAAEQHVPNEFCKLATCNEVDKVVKCIPAKQDAESPTPPLQFAQERARAALALFGQYPVCPHCGRTDRPVCCVPVEQDAPVEQSCICKHAEKCPSRCPRGFAHSAQCHTSSSTLCLVINDDVHCAPVEQPTPESPAPLLDLDKIREWNMQVPPALTTVLEMCDETEGLRNENAVLKTALTETFTDLDLGHGEIEKLRVKLAELKGLAIARWLSSITSVKRQCNAAEQCTAADECDMGGEHDVTFHVNCGVTFNCYHYEGEEVRCEAVAE